MESSHQNKILHWCRNVWVYHVLNFVNANSPQILKGPKPGTPHVINVHGFTLNKIYQKQKQKQKSWRSYWQKDEKDDFLENFGPAALYFASSTYDVTSDGLVADSYIGK